METEYKNLRCYVFHNFEPGEMLTNIQTYVFPFIKTIGEGKDTAFCVQLINPSARDAEGFVVWNYLRLFSRASIFLMGSMMELTLISWLLAATK